MYPVSAAFLAEATRSHQVVTAVDVYQGGVKVKTLEVTGGSVKADLSQRIRRQANLTLVDPDGTLTPAAAGDLLSPYGTELFLYRGIRIPTSGSAGYTDELVPLGVFGIGNASVEDSGPAVTISLTGYDRARRVSRAKMTDTYQIASGTNVGTAIQTLINSRVPGLTFNFTPTTSTTPNIILDVGVDPWAACSVLAQSIGYELYFDVQGTCVLRPLPDVETSPVVATFAEGTASTVISLGQEQDNEEVYSHVVVTGESTSNTTPARGEASDTNVASPTYVSGPYGDVVLHIQSALVTSNLQAATVAAAELRKVSGYVARVKASVIPNPALDLYDVVAVTRAASKISANYAIETFEIPLSFDQQMTISARRRVA